MNIIVQQSSGRHFETLNHRLLLPGQLTPIPDLVVWVLATHQANSCLEPNHNFQIRIIPPDPSAYLIYWNPVEYILS